MLGKHIGTCARRFNSVTEVVIGNHARDQMLKGADILANAVAATMGPRGRNVILQQPYSLPKITKDGVSVAKAIELPDPLQNMGANLIKQVAQNANDKSGDGTTTATVLARNIYKDACSAVAAGVNPIELLKGVKLASTAVAEFLEKNTKEVTDADIFNVACVSANGDEVIGKLISDAMKAVGRDGVITVADGKTLQHSISYVEGYQFDRGIVSPYFSTSTKAVECVFAHNPLLLISEDKLCSIEALIPVLEHAMETQSELAIIADDFDQELVSTLLINKVRSGLKVCAIKAPSFGDYRRNILHDIAALTGATVYNNVSGGNVVTRGMLGSCKKIVSKKDSTLLLDGTGTQTLIDSRISQIMNELAAPEIFEYEKEKLEQRLGKLTGKVAQILVGGGSEIEVAEIKDRVDDSLCSTKAAVDSGVLPGGGSALLFAKKSINELHGDSPAINAGIDIVRKACEAPLRQIAANAGFDGSLIVGELMHRRDFGVGFNVINGKYENLLSAGIVDPLKVVKTAFADAASIASLMATSEAAVFPITEKDKQPLASTF